MFLIGLGNSETQSYLLHSPSTTISYIISQKLLINFVDFTPILKVCTTFVPDTLEPLSAFKTLAIILLAMSYMQYNKFIMTLINFLYYKAVRRHRGAGGSCSLTFLRSKKKKKKQRKKRKSFKAGTIERLSPRSKCYCFRY